MAGRFGAAQEARTNAAAAISARAAWHAPGYQPRTGQRRQFSGPGLRPWYGRPLRKADRRHLGGVCGDRAGGRSFSPPSAPRRQGRRSTCRRWCARSRRWRNLSRQDRDALCRKGETMPTGPVPERYDDILNSKALGHMVIGRCQSQSLMFSIRVACSRGVGLGCCQAVWNPRDRSCDCSGDIFASALRTLTPPYLPGALAPAKLR